MTPEAIPSFSSFDYYDALTRNPKENSVLFISRKGIILKVNRAFLLSFGYDEQDVVGQPVSMLFSEEDRRKDRPGREINTVLDEGQCFDNNYLVRKDRVLTWVSGESILIQNEQGEKCILKIIQNIHTQKESENSIIQLNNFNEHILSMIEDAVIVLGSDFTIVKANRSWFRLFRLENEDLARMDFRALMQPFDSHFNLFRSISATLANGPASSRIQTEFNEPGGGDKKVFDISLTRLDLQGDQHNVLIIFHDVTAQKLFEKKIEDILNFVGHELRNPLTSVMLSIGLTEELLKEKNVSELSQPLAIIRNNVARINKLVKELYNSSSISSGKLSVQGNLFDLEEMVRESVETIRLIYPAYTVTLLSDEDCIVYGDRDRLNQVITNYLTNAVKYSPGRQDIEVAIKCEEKSIVVSVKDHGIGIPAKELPYIFSRFFRAEKTKDLEGLGLGLFLCRQIIRSHNGHAWVESREGEGSTFYFSLPIAPVSILEQ
jgi:PAS domain S-box-containing protein